MDEELGNIMFGANPDEIVLGKDPDFISPLRKFAIILGFCIVGSFFLSIFVEEYRLQAIMQEVRSMSLNGIQCAVEEMQNIGEEDMDYLFDDFNNPTDEYDNYLDSLSNIPNDEEMQNVVKLLRYGDSNGEKYTPLSFNLTYLDKNKLKSLIETDLVNIFEASNSTNVSEGKISNGSIFEELIIGSERAEFVSCDVQIEKMNVIDITDINSCSDYDKAMYRAVYGSQEQSVSKLDGLGLTEKHYLIVYQVKYSVTWIPYSRTFFLQRKDSGFKKNSDGFLALPEVTDEYTELYYITN